jgi:putative iron-dependent peroxidase
MTSQPGILLPLPAHARHLTYRLRPGADPCPALTALRDRGIDERMVIGIGASIARALGAQVEGLRSSPSHAGPGVNVPSTPSGLYLWLRGDDRGELLLRGRGLSAAVADAFELDEALDTFKYESGLDLSGYEDGTENPKGEDAVRAAFADDGSSFVAVQRWVHALERLDAMGEAERDDVFGRRRSDNEELDDAPASAHVKRAAQESFDPEAFMLRRSMPWSEGDAHGLVFVAYGRSFDAFEAVLRRMVGEEDSITDALFTFTRPVTGRFFWCPPVHEGRLDLRALGL